MDRFVVGSGRCGSTLLSRMLQEDPEVLSVSEFFVGLDRVRRFNKPTAETARFVRLLSRLNVEGLNFTSRGIRMPEILYPYDSPESRFELNDPIPWIQQITLPTLAGDSDELFDSLMAACREFPERPLADQCRGVFQWLANRQGSSDWIERSGSSLEYMDELVDLFPKGRYLHLHRDGRESALSMREHAAFRYRVAFLYEIPDEEGVQFSFMRTYDPTQGASDSQHLTDILEARAPVEFFGRYWSAQLETGRAAIAKLDSSQYLEMSFEDLIDDTLGSLARLVEFFELPGDRSQAHKRAAALIRGHPETRFDRISVSQQGALDEACTPGMLQLGLFS
jgi:hypothetical protein